MRIRCIAVMFLCALLLSSCTAGPVAPIVTQDASLPAPQEENLRVTETASTLWFRFRDEAYLAPASRVVTASPTVSYEHALLDALLAGPGSAASELQGLFPPGTRVLSTHREGRRLFVTLSKEIMHRFADETDAWQSDPVRLGEIRVRRALAMEAIVATVTENCEIDSVVILVEQTATALDSLRLRQGYYRLGTGDDMALADELTRDDAWLLTPARTAEIILQCWQDRDFARLYRYTARTEAVSAHPLEEAAFQEEMTDMPHLLTAELSHASVNAAGDRAVFALDVTLLEHGQPVERNGAVLQLIRQGGVWRIPAEQLTRWKEAAP